MNNIKYTVIGVLTSLLIGYGLGRYVVPSKIDIQEKQVVIKETETIVREIKNPDGTIVKETIVKDTSKKEKDKQQTTINSKSKNDIALFSKYSFENNEVLYGVHYQRRIGDSPFKVGVLVDTKKTIGVSIGLEF